ncbi:putative sodium-coupled neutral amino acid transporter 6 [Iris pallida]|uniref:Sodium-coupled neutral amino acid transporter 6 n=1 Tax=Iris pallida TaxID=29817 RepID=A0AAX6H058_IRIPA|nr:putative sodium-coupled neutral amino acid transporter 6 [Iris pallida]
MKSLGKRMKTNYSAIPFKSSSIELQNKPSNEPKQFYVEEYTDEFDEIDDFPLIPEGGGAAGGPEAADAGVPGAVFNLATSIIGAGIMALPAAMKVLGLALGFVSIVVMGVLSEISIELLVRYSVLSKAASYGEVVEAALGRAMRVVSEVCIVVNNAGVLVVYLIIIGDVMSGSSDHVGVFDQLFDHGVWDHRKMVILVVLIVFLAPLCALEKIDSLSLTSAASVALAVVFVVISCAVAFIKLVDGTIQKPRMGPDFSTKASILDLLVVIPIMTNAYVCHFNVQPIYNELDGRSPQKMNRVGRISTVMCVVVYAATAVSGYLLFGDETESDVLTNFDKNLGAHFSMVLNYIVRIGYVLHLVLVFPVIHFSLRQTVDALVFTNSVLDSRKKSLALTAVLLGVIYVGSTMIPNIWVAFKFTGATTGLSLGFIFPALITLRLDKHDKSLTNGEKAVSWLMLVLAAVVSVVGVAGNIYSIQNQS